MERVERKSKASQRRGRGGGGARHPSSHRSPHPDPKQHTHPGVQRFTYRDMVQRGVGRLDGLGAGDSRLLLNVLPAEVAARSFADALGEVDFQAMLHRGHPVPRDVALQGDVHATSGGDVVPCYRHPVDSHPALQPWTPAVRAMRDRASEAIGGQPLNHALIQLYRHGKDNISEHCDKTLDIGRGSLIVNLSLGATRVMQLSEKGSDRKQLVYLPHNSLFVLGWETNRTWRHAILPDGRQAVRKAADERREDGRRISLTMRHITTFHRADGVLFGQGARHKTLEVAAAARVDGGGGDGASSGGRAAHREALGMVKAFSIENRALDFDWDRAYGHGFNCTDLASLKRGRGSGADDVASQPAAAAQPTRQPAPGGAAAAPKARSWAAMASGMHTRPQPA